MDESPLLIISNCYADSVTSCSNLVTVHYAVGCGHPRRRRAWRKPSDIFLIPPDILKVCRRHPVRRLSKQLLAWHMAGAAQGGDACHATWSRVRRLPHQTRRTVRSTD